jgi:hypothetical protein
MSMCDYSLDFVASRPAKIGDQLVTTKFAAPPLPAPQSATYMTSACAGKETRCDPPGI